MGRSILETWTYKARVVRLSNRAITSANAFPMESAVDESDVTNIENELEVIHRKKPAIMLDDFKDFQQVQPLCHVRPEDMNANDYPSGTES